MLLSQRSALAVFALVLLSYAAQSELAQAIQKTYKKPYFLLYLTHSGYSFIAPLHLLAVKVLRIDRALLLQRLHEAISSHIDFRATATTWSAADDDNADPADRKLMPWRELWVPYFRMVAIITVAITVPALSWYCAVPLTSITDVTSLYNSNAFWAYLMAIYLTKTEHMEWRKGLAVVLACFGVVVIAYGDSQDDNESQEKALSGRLLGSLLALFGSITYALYEVYYSRFVALGDVPVTVAPPSVSLRRSASGRPLMSSPAANRKSYSQIGDADDDEEALEIGERSPDTNTFRVKSAGGVSDQAVYLAYANTVTASIGFTTIALLWIPIPLLHWLGIETFELPPIDVLLPICGVVAGGVVYNGAFMVLLGQWGPIIASVGNLCTLVLVAAADVLLVGATLTLWTLAGSSLIIGAFAVLAVDALRSS